MGGNLREFIGDRKRLSASIRLWNLKLNVSLARLHRMDAPSAVSIHGMAAGGTFVHRIGLRDPDRDRGGPAYASNGYCPHIGGTINLARRIGLARAVASTFFVSSPMQRQRSALAWWTKWCLKPSCWAAPKKIAQRWVQGPTRAYGAIRSLMHGVHCTPMETQLELEAQQLAQLARTDDSCGTLGARLRVNEKTTV